MKDKREEVRLLIIAALTKIPQVKKPISGRTKIHLHGLELVQFCNRVETLSNRQYIVPPRFQATTVNDLAIEVAAYRKP